jgi:ferredoxin-thioredoxin reductase catalytic subunit
MAKKFWRCNVCNDVHYGLKPPAECPTCKAMNAFVEVSEKEAKTVMGADEAPGISLDKNEVMRVWQEFDKRSGEFRLNPEKKIVEMVLEGVLANEKSKGLKLCPCRVGDGTKARDLALICPCNFKTHPTWAGQNRCWCGLFVKK